MAAGEEMGKIQDGKKLRAQILSHVRVAYVALCSCKALLNMGYQGPGGFPQYLGTIGSVNVLQ